MPSQQPQKKPGSDEIARLPIKFATCFICESTELCIHREADLIILALERMGFLPMFGDIPKKPVGKANKRVDY